MWTYTSYILWKYCEKNPTKYEGLFFTELAEFIFDVLWRKEGLIFHDGTRDLYLDLKYLKQLKVIEFEQNENLEKIKLKITDKNKLGEIVKVVENSATVTGVKLFDQYMKRINAAVESVNVAT